MATSTKRKRKEEVEESTGPRTVRKQAEPGRRIKNVTNYTEIYYVKINRGSSIEIRKQERYASSLIKAILKHTVTEWMAGRIDADFASREDSCFFDRLFRYSIKKRGADGRRNIYVRKEREVKLSDLLNITYQPVDPTGDWPEALVRAVAADGSKGDLPLTIPAHLQEQYETFLKARDDAEEVA